MDVLHMVCSTLPAYIDAIISNKLIQNAETKIPTSKIHMLQLILTNDKSHSYM